MQSSVFDGSLVVHSPPTQYSMKLIFQSGLLTLTFSNV